MPEDVGLTVDPRRDEPIYRQIFDQVVARVQAGTFPAGYKLPPTRVLAKTLRTHRNTVARAYADLEDAGFVTSTVGRGTFVEPQSLVPNARAGAAPKPTDAGAMPWSSLLSRGARVDTLGRAERFTRPNVGQDVVNLVRMQPSEDLLPHELMRRSVERVFAELGAKALAYAPPEGVARLREQIAIDLSTRGVPATADDVLVTTGSQQALDLVTRALVDPGDAILVDPTTYSGAIDLFALAGARLLPVPNDGEGPDPRALERYSRSGAKALYVMPNGHNPTGRTISAARRHELVAWSRAAGIPIIEDDYGAGLTLDEHGALPHLRALDGDVIHVSTFSKRLIPALRAGILVTPRALRSVLRPIKRVMDLGTSAVLQHALADFLERGYLRAHTTRILAEYRARRDALEGALHKHMPREVRWDRPTHGVVLWLRLPATIEPERLYEEALRQGVLVSPSSLWSVEPGTERGIRIAFCAEPRERIVLGVQRLGKAMRLLLASNAKSGHQEQAAMEVV
jgi:GntR family transcriptional regulator/MocR family aminotransferase